MPNEVGGGKVKEEERGHERDQERDEEKTSSVPKEKNPVFLMGFVWVGQFD